MTWEELTGLLSELAREHDTEVKIIAIEGLEAVFLHLPPAAWFSSMKFAGALNIGVYQGEENRLVGTAQIPLAELTPEFVREKVEKAAAEQFASTLDPQVVKECFERIAIERITMPAGRDVEVAG